MDLVGIVGCCKNAEGGKVAVVGCRVDVGLHIVGFHVGLNDGELERISFETKLWV